MLRNVLAAEGISAEIKEVLIVDQQMAINLNFFGSPTIRVDGCDVAEEGSKNGAFACRLYPGSQQPGVPPIEIVRRALVRARETSTP
jgi:hypothetical protein